MKESQHRNVNKKYAMKETMAVTIQRWSAESKENRNQPF